MVAWIPFFSFGVFFTPLVSEFGWTRALTSGIFSAAHFMRGLSGIVMGRLNDKVGPRIVLTVCGSLLGLGYLLMYFVHSLWQIYVFFVFLMGIGLSGFWVPILSTVARWFVKRRATMSGIVNSSTGVATLIGAPVSTVLLSIYNWRICYVIMGVFILLIIPASAQFLRREPSVMGQFPDGEKEHPAHQKTKPAGLSLNEAIRSRHFWLYFFAAMSFAYCVFTIMVHIVPHAIGLNLSPVQAAGMLAIYGGMGLLGRLVMGNAADKMGDRMIYLIGFIINSVSLLWLVMAKEVWMLYLFVVISGMVQGGMGAVGSPLLAELFGLRAHGTIFGVANVGYTLGAALGPIVTGYIFDVTDSYQQAFMLSAAVSVIGIILAALLRRPLVKLG